MNNDDEEEEEFRANLLFYALFGTALKNHLKDNKSEEDFDARMKRDTTLGKKVINQNKNLQGYDLVVTPRKKAVGLYLRKKKATE